MSNISKEILRNYVNEQKFKSPDEVLAAMKEMFKNVLQEALEAEMDTQLGYDKYDVTKKQTTNSINGYSKRTIKSELGAVELNIPRDRNSEYEPKIIPKYKRNVTGIEDKVMALYAA